MVLLTEMGKLCKGRKERRSIFFHGLWHEDSLILSIKKKKKDILNLREGFPWPQSGQMRHSSTSEPENISRTIEYLLYDKSTQSMIDDDT